MNIKLVFCAAALASFGLIACGDDTTGTGGGGQGGGGTGGSTTTTTTSGGGNGGDGGGTAALTCAEACSAVYDCGAANDGALCPGFTPDGTDKATFVGDDQNGCIATCNAQPALLAIVDPDECADTIGSLKAVGGAEFNAACDGAAGGGGAGGN